MNRPAASSEMFALIGPAGSGKSTLAAEIAQHDPDVVVLGLDDCRARVSRWGDPADQAATPAAVDLLHLELDEHLAAGRRVLVDATNAVAEHRQPLLQIAARHTALTTAIVVLPPLETCLQRNAARDPAVGACGYARRVPDAVISEMYTAIASDWDRINHRESWHTVHLFAWWQGDSASPRVTCGGCGGDAVLIDEYGRRGLPCPADCDEGLIALSDLVRGTRR